MWLVYAKQYRWQRHPSQPSSCLPFHPLHDGHPRTMDASARTLAASLILIITAALLARSISPSSSSSSDGKPTIAHQTKTQRVKRDNKKSNQTSMERKET